MSAAIYPDTREPYGWPAGILALVVHGAFFALLYFGFTWRTASPPAMDVELWQSLPEPEAVPPPVMKVEEAVRPLPPPALPEKAPEPEIAMPDKKKLEKKPKPVVSEPVKKKTVKKPVEQKMDRKAVREQAAREQSEREAREMSEREQATRERAARERAEREAEIGKVVDEYGAKIRAKIKRNIVMPPNVPEEARAEFRVTLLPGGSVLEARLVKSSGNAAYDSAVERAILKSDPLPLPPDVSLFSRFRNLNLRFQPGEQ